MEKELLSLLLTVNLFTIQICQTILMMAKWRSTSKKVQQEIKQARYNIARRSGIKKRRKMPPQRNREVILDARTNVFEQTGLFEDEFLNICNLVENSVVSPRAVVAKKKVAASLGSRSRILLVLDWLKSYHTYAELGRTYGVSKSFVSRDIKHILPLLWQKLDFIKWDMPNWSWIANTLDSGDRFSGIIDCTSHFRYKVHPRSCDLYRTDKKGFFITAQVVIDNHGLIRSVHLGLGHNNDQQMWKLTEMGPKIQLSDLNLLGDRGYTHPRVYTPVDDFGWIWNEDVASRRVRVEHKFAAVKNTWSFTDAVVHHSLEVHQMGLIVCYQLSNIVKLRELEILQ